MSEEDIKKIAREYAHLRAFDGGFFPKEDEIAEDFEVCLQLLSKDYCIVPKEDVLNQHAWYMQRMKEVSSNRQMNRGKAIALENLFGREMFEQKGE